MKINLLNSYSFSSRYSSYPSIYSSQNVVHLLEPENEIKCFDLSSGKESWSFQAGKNIVEYGQLLNNYYFSVYYGRRKESELIRINASGEAKSFKPDFRPIYFDEQKFSDGELNLYDIDSLERIDSNTHLLDELKSCNIISEKLSNVSELYPNLLTVQDNFYLLEITSPDDSLVIAIDRAENLNIKYVLEGEDAKFRFKNYLVLNNKKQFDGFNIFDIKTGVKLGEIEFSSNIREIDDKIYYRAKESGKLKVWSQEECVKDLDLDQEGEDVVYFFTDKFLIASTANTNKNFQLFIYNYEGKTLHHEDFGAKGFEVYSATSEYLAIYKSNTINIYCVTD